MSEEIKEKNTDLAGKIGEGCGTGCVVIFLLIIVLFIIGCFLPESPELTANKAFVSCRGFVKERLKAPASAKFSSDVTYKKEGENIYIINSYVDSQNSFGAMLRQNFICKIKMNSDDNRELLELTFF